jgi:hypothetical protein
VRDECAVTEPADRPGGTISTPSILEGWRAQIAAQPGKLFLAEPALQFHVDKFIDDGEVGKLREMAYVYERWAAQCRFAANVMDGRGTGTEQWRTHSGN